MDVILLFTIASGLIVVLFIVALTRQRKTNTEAPQERAPRETGQQVPRRAVAARNARARMRAAARHQDESEEEEEALQELGDKIALPDGKIGAKKRAKLEAKAERRAQREAEEKVREEKKKRDARLEEERKKQEERDKVDEAKRLEIEKQEREEKERQEYEEYLKMKEAFSVEEEGFEEGEEEGGERNLLKEFVDYIKGMKVVVLEDLAAHFKLKTQSVIDRIQLLQEDGILTGVVDDRGKFIYISTEELEAVAKFVKQRGRVSIAELVESSNELINLNVNKLVPVQQG